MPEQRSANRSAAPLLSRTALFTGLAARPLSDLAAHARVCDVDAGTVLYRRGDPGDQLFIVVSGGPVDVLVAGLDGGELLLGQAGPLESFGELALIDQSVRPDMARAAAPARIIALPCDAVLKAAVTAPQIMQRLVGGLGATVRRVIDHASSTSFLDLHERIVLALVEIEARVARGATPPTFEELRRQLPGTVGSTPEAVDEVLASFEELGYLEARRDHVRISSNRPQRTVLSGGLSWTALVNQVLHDPLTQLANRMLFHERLHQAVTDSHDETRCAAVLMIDLDGFKAVNDTLGHAVGDELLVKVAERLRGCLRRPDTPARLGGDEFAVVVTDVDSRETAIRVAERVLTAVGRPYLIGDEIVSVGASIGVALSESHSADQTIALLGRADAAMYRAKRAGKRRWEMESFDEDALQGTRQEPLSPLTDRRRTPAVAQRRHHQRTARVGELIGDLFAGLSDSDFLP